MAQSNPDDPTVTLDMRVATVQNDVQHLSHRVDRVEEGVTLTRNELKSEVVRVEADLKSDIVRVNDELKSDIDRLSDKIEETRKELKSDIIRVEQGLKSEIAAVGKSVSDLGSTLRREMRHDRTAVYAFTGAAIVGMFAVLAKGLF